jgi:hypothetical protein
MGQSWETGGQVFYAYTISANVDEEIGRSGIWGEVKEVKGCRLPEWRRERSLDKGTSIDRLIGIHR